MLLSDYIKTKEWRKKRLETFIRKGKKCMKCGSEKQIHVHHSTYERLGNETIDTDLFPLCKRCHNYFHKHYTGHFIQNTLDFISIKELPKYEPAKKISCNKLKNKRNTRKPIKKRGRKTLEERRKNRKPRVKKVKEPFQSTTYNATQGKEYKFNNFKL